MTANESLLVAAPLMIAAILMAVRFVGCGLAGSTGTGGEVFVVGELKGRGGLSATAGFPDNKPYTEEYDSAGTYTYAIPYWCTRIDLILLGAGGGGTYGGVSNGKGGGAGGWKTATLQRGTDIAWATTSIDIVVGQGGAAGTFAGAQATAGGDTTATWEMTTQTASGGGAGASTGGQVGEGPDPRSQSVGDAVLTAGVAQPTPGGAGNAPGGGGAGSDAVSRGGVGADGAAVVVGRQE